MSIRIAIAFVALSISSSARADVILTYHLSLFNGPGNVAIPNNLPLGPQITSVDALGLGELRYLQVAISGTLPLTGSQANWVSGNGLVCFGFALNYPGVVSQPYVPPGPPALTQNQSNFQSQSPFSVGHPNTFMGYNAGATAVTGLDLGQGLEATAGLLSPTVLATFKLVGASQGGGVITITELNTIPTAGEFGLVNVTSLDPIVFAPSHNSFPLPITVVPEPSAMALMGLAAAGFAWKRRRK